MPVVTRSQSKKARDEPSVKEPEPSVNKTYVVTSKSLLHFTIPSVKELSVKVKEKKQNMQRKKEIIFKYKEFLEITKKGDQLSISHVNTIIDLFEYVSNTIVEFCEFDKLTKQKKLRTTILKSIQNLHRQCVLSLGDERLKDKWDAYLNLVNTMKKAKRQLLLIVEPEPTIEELDKQIVELKQLQIVELDKQIVANLAELNKLETIRNSMK